jgi:hypothetical protein
MNSAYHQPVIKKDVTIAFKICDSCIRSYPAVHQLCQLCHGALRAVERAIDDATSTKEEPTVPIEPMLTVEGLVDELTLHLAAIDEMHGENDRRRKYYAQAQGLMYRIPVSRPTPAFVINLSDLTPRLLQELENCKKPTLEYVIKSAVSRLFENLDYNYFHLSVARSLVVRLEK